MMSPVEVESGSASDKMRQDRGCIISRAGTEAHMAGKKKAGKTKENVGVKSQLIQIQLWQIRHNSKLLEFEVFSMERNNG